jgi:hypothetical protein
VKRNRAPILKTKILYFLLFTPFIALSSAPTPRSFDELKLNERQKKALINGDFLVKSQIKTYRNKSEKTQDPGDQSLDYAITGLHPKPCSIALRRLTLYENYSDYLSFVTRSAYVEEQQRIVLLLGHQLLPFDMGLDFILPKMTGPGVFPLSFDRGFLSGLTGTIEISEHRDRCLFHAEAKWRGPHTGIRDSVFRLFSSTLSRLSMAALFRASMTP